MKIAIITSGLLPIPASKGGAIETLIDSFTKENELSINDINIDIYSIYDKCSKKIVKKQNYKKCKYIYVNNIPSLLTKIFNKTFKTKLSINKYYQNRVSSLINKKKYSFVIVENYPELSLKIKNHKVIPYIHSDVFNIEIPNGNEILKKCYKVITVSDFIKNRVLEIDLNCSNKVITVYNSIDFKFFSDNEIKKNRNEIRKQYNISNDAFVYAFSGRISKEKGPLELVKAFNKINVPNKKLLIIGGIWYGSNRSNDYLDQLKNISNDNIIYTGYVNHDDVEKILCAVDVGAVPSICNEAAGLSVVEFMSVGAFVVASNMGGIKEYLNVRDNYLVDYKNEKQFINDLANYMELCYNCSDRSVVAQNNIDFAKKFTTIQNYKNIIKKLK